MRVVVVLPLVPVTPMHIERAATDRRRIGAAELRERAARVAHVGPRVMSAQQRRRERLLDDDHARAARNGFADEAMTVGVRAAQRDEAVRRASRWRESISIARDVDAGDRR